MKKTFSYFLMLLSASVIISCSNEDNEMNPTNSESKIQLVKNGENSALKFDTEATYQSTLKKLKDMSNADRIAFAKSYGLTSLQELAKEADKELEEIGASATSEADFRDKYEQYKSKYAGVLIKNQYDPEDLQLYVPDGDELSTYLLGKDQTVIIGEEDCKVSLANDMSKSDKSVFTPRVSTRAAGDVNGFQNITGHKKTTCSVTNTFTGQVKVHIGFQKKMWYGWKNDGGRKGYYRITLSNFRYSYSEPPAHVVFIDRPDLYAFKEQSSIDFVTGQIITSAPSATGNLYVWTDMTSGPALVNYQRVVTDGTQCGPKQLPRCDDYKAYSCALSFYRM